MIPNVGPNQCFQTWYLNLFNFSYVLLYHVSIQYLSCMTTTLYEKAIHLNYNSQWLPCLHQHFLPVYGEPFILVTRAYIDRLAWHQLGLFLFRGSDALDAI